MLRKKKQKTAIIVGSGLIGTHLSKILLKEGVRTIVVTRMLTKYNNNYKKLKINEKVRFVRLNLTNKKKIRSTILKYKPNFIYYFAGQRSIPKSFKKPKETYLSNYLGAKNYLDIIKREMLPIQFFKANSGYIFNGSKKKITLENKLVKADSPYTKSQIKSYKLIKKYRNLGINCYSIIFFNIVSPSSPMNLVAKKICFLSSQIKKKRINEIKVGNIKSIRDFGWAPEMVKAVYLMKNLRPRDMLIGSGKGMSIKKLIYYAFNYQKLNYKKYIKIDKKLYRRRFARLKS